MYSGVCSKAVKGELTLTYRCAPSHSQQFLSNFPTEDEQRGSILTGTHVPSDVCLHSSQKHCWLPRYPKIHLSFLKNINLRKIRGCSCADACRMVVKSQLKLLLGGRWDVRQHHWVGSNRKPCSVPGQQSFEWEFWLCHRLDAAVWWLQLQQGNQGKVLWEAFLITLVCREIFKLNASLSRWPYSQHSRGKVAKALHSAPGETHYSI